MKTPAYLVEIEKAFIENSNTGQAIEMSKYMKDKFAFFGIKSPERKELYKSHWKKHGHIPEDKIEEIVKWCWTADQREYQYYIIETLTKQVKKVNQPVIELFEFMIVNKSWWDTVDGIASNLVGVYFTIYPEQVNRITDKWMASGNMWLQRTCILFQLKYKSKTNSQLLEKFIEPLIDSNEFFIKKAIGWALREYSKTNFDFVVQFVRKHNLSGLSEREALKWMRNKSMIR